MMRLTFAAGMITGLAIGAALFGVRPKTEPCPDPGHMECRIKIMEAENRAIRTGLAWLEYRTIILDTCGNPLKLRK